MLLNGFKVQFFGCSNLTTVHPNAFKSLSNVLVSLSIQSSSLTNSVPPEPEIFQTIKSLPALLSLDLQSNKFTSIPGHSFGPENQGLLSIDFTSNPITRINTKAFLNLPNLEHIRFYNNRIDTIEDYAFETKISEDKSKTLSIMLSSEREWIGTRPEAFQPLSLAGINRPCSINVGGPLMKTLNKEAFETYLKDVDHNINWYNVYGNVTCDCKMFWLWKGRERYRKQFGGVIVHEHRRLWCDNFRDKQIWDLNKEDFGNCE